MDAYFTTYDNIVESWGYHVIDSESFGSYQGDSVYILQDGTQVGYVVIGFGSCTGCDALEAILYFNNTDLDALEREVNELSSQYHRNIKWYSSQDAFAAALDSNDPNEWYYYEPDIRGYLQEVANHWPVDESA